MTKLIRRDDHRPCTSNNFFKKRNLCDKDYLLPSIVYHTGYILTLKGKKNYENTTTTNIKKQSSKENSSRKRK
jgi:hypothetical protein